jgi:hypothetical protein
MPRLLRGARQHREPDVESATGHRRRLVMTPHHTQDQRFLAVEDRQPPFEVDVRPEAERTLDCHSTGPCLGQRLVLPAREVDKRAGQVELGFAQLVSPRG